MPRSRTAGFLARSGSDGASAPAHSESGLVAGAAADGDVRRPFRPCAPAHLPHGERANVEDAASGDAAYNSTRPDDEGGFWAVGLDWVVEREGVIKCITVIHLILRPLRRS